MKKKLFLNLLLVLLLSFVSIVHAKINVADNGYMVQKLANMSTPTITGVSSSNDLVTVRATGNIVGYYYGASTSLNSASYTSTSSSTFYASVKNGIYYFWVAGAGVSTGNVNAVMYPYAVKVTTSCSNQTVKNCTSTGTFERCFVYTGGKSVSPEQGGELVTPAAGYKLDSVTVSKNNCSNLSLSVGNQKLSRRYCKVIFAFKCSKIAADVCQTSPNSADCICKNDPWGVPCACAKDASSASCICGNSPGSKECACAKDPNSTACKGSSTPTTPTCSSGYHLENGRCVKNTPSYQKPYLTGLSINVGSLSPSFSSTVQRYTAAVNYNITQVTINATGPRGVSAGTIYGTGTKALSYGENTFKVTIVNSVGAVDYYITITRRQNCSKDNTLKELTVSGGDLEPKFQAGVNSYTVKIAKESTVKVDAVVSDSKTAFVDGFGPREVKVVPGNNRVDIKTKNECGEEKIYAVNIVVPQVCDPTPEKSAKLKSLELKSSRDDVELPKIDFKPDEFIYSGLEIPNKYGQLEIVAATETEGDKIEITGLPSVLQVNKETPVSVVVTSKKCPDVQKTYTLILTRLEDKPLPDNASLASFSITGHSEFQFKKNQNDYKVLKLKKGEKKVKLNYVPEEKTTVCIHSVTNSRSSSTTTPTDADFDAAKAAKQDYTVNVVLGSVITVTCKAADGVSKETYTVKVVSAAKKTNGFLIFLVVVIIILLLIYLVLRLLGYKIYFNFGIIGSFFRGIGESIKNLFDR